MGGTFIRGLQNRRAPKQNSNIFEHGEILFTSYEAINAAYEKRIYQIEGQLSLQKITPEEYQSLTKRATIALKTYIKLLSTERKTLS